MDRPIEITDVEKDVNAEMMQDFTGETSGFVQVGPEKYLLPRKYRETAEDYYNFVVRPDDVWIVTYPRSGTTWTQEMIWLLANNLDYKKAETPLPQRFPFFEESAFWNPKFIENILEINKFSAENLAILETQIKPPFEMLEKTTEKRFIKTHLPLQLLPPDLLSSGAKVIYVARNPKNVAVSYFHFHKTTQILGFSNEFSKFWDYFQRDLVRWSPYWSHIQEAWEKRHEKNLLFVFYEEINKDLNQSIRKISDFLEAKYSDNEFKILEQHLSFENFRNNKSVNGTVNGVRDANANFIRQGKTGGVENYFEGDLKIKADKWIEEKLTKTDLRFPY